MKKVFSALAEELKLRASFVLLTVLESSGSTPRGAGAEMLVFSDGTQTGTIGGGAAEYAAAEKAKEILVSKASCMQEYIMTPNEIADLGMICGGKVTVCFQYLDGKDQKARDIFTKLTEHMEQGENLWLCRKLKDGVVIDYALAKEDAILCGSCVDKTVLLPALSNQPNIVVAGDVVWFIEQVCRSGKVYLFGGGHVSQALAPVLTQLDFRVAVYEDREAFVTTALFPTAEERILAPFEEMTDSILLKSSDYAVIMTRGHQADYTILRQVLKTPAGYIGCIGSRNKIALTKARLLEEGFTEADFQRVHTPIGLAIGAQTPQEIAISIAAEMIRYRATGE